MCTRHKHHYTRNQVNWVCQVTNWSLRLRYLFRGGRWVQKQNSWERVQQEWRTRRDMTLGAGVEGTSEVACRGGGTMSLACIQTPTPSVNRRAQAPGLATSFPSNQNRMAATAGREVAPLQLGRRAAEWSNKHRSTAAVACR